MDLKISENIILSEDKERLDIDFIHSFLKKTYWSKNISRDFVERSIENSLSFGLYESEKQIGFARVITDYTIFGYLADVFISPHKQRQGLGKKMVQEIVNYPKLKTLRRWHLLTQDAHEIYKDAGFNHLEKVEKHMELIKKIKI